MKTAPLSTPAAHLLPSASLPARARRGTLASMREIVSLGAVLLVGLAPTISVAGATIGQLAKDEVLPTAASEDTQRALRSVIEAQLAAFRANDYEAAYHFAADEMRARFSTEQFEAMVRMGYPIISQGHVVEFGDVYQISTQAIVEVEIQDKEERSARYRYMLRQQNGEWRIDGVVEMPKKKKEFVV